MITRHPQTERIKKLRPVFFQVGLLIALGITLGAFKWTTYSDNVDIKFTADKVEEETALGAINVIEEFKKEVQKTKEKKLTPPDPDKMNLVDNDVKVDTNIADNSKEVDLSKIIAAKPQNPFGGAPKVVDPNPITTYAEKMPSYPGGYAERSKFIQKNFRIPYDVQMYAKRVSVYISAVVEKNGILSNIEVVKNGGYPSAGEAAKKMVEQMPRWNPGYQGIWPVRVRVIIPIKIRIE